MTRLQQFAGVFALLLVASCSPAEPDTLLFPDSEDTEEISPSPTDSDLLNFSAPRLGGGQMTGSELQGKDVALWFWAPW